MKEHLEEVLSEEERIDWETKMAEPLCPVKLSEKEISSLIKDGVLKE